MKLPSGLFDNDIEIVTHENKTMAIHQGSVKEITSLPSEILKNLYDDMFSNENAILALRMQGIECEEEMLLKYLSCRYGEFDNVPDVVNGRLQAPEVVKCALRGECPMEGIVCSFPTFNGAILSPFEINMIQELATEKIIPVIAEDMQVSINTFELRKKLLFQKLKVQSRARMVAVSYEKNLIQKEL